MRRKTQVSLFQIFRSEGKPEDLMPNLRSTGWRMGKIYIFLTCLFTGLVMLAGIPLWDALNLVMVAIATGGFTLHSAGIAYYNNPLLEVLLLPVMFAGAIPFKLYFLMYRGKMDALFRDKTIRLLLLIALAGSAIVSLELYIFNGLLLSMHSGRVPLSRSRVSAPAGSRMLTPMSGLQSRLPCSPFWSSSEGQWAVWPGGLKSTG